MIGSVLPRGRDVGGLLRYLFREGRAGDSGLAAEHTAPRLIGARDSDLTRLEPGRTRAGGRDVRALAAALSAPVAVANVDPATKPVHHLAIAAAKDPRTGQLLDKHLSDWQWAGIAAEYPHQMGRARRGDEQAVRWVAVRHADDHVHLVATLCAAGLSSAPWAWAWAWAWACAGACAWAGAASWARPCTRKHQATVDAQRRAGRPVPSAPDRLVLRQRVRAAAAGSSG